MSDTKAISMEPMTPSPNDTAQIMTAREHHKLKCCSKQSPSRCNNQSADSIVATPWNAFEKNAKTQNKVLSSYAVDSRRPCEDAE